MNLPFERPVRSRRRVLRPIVPPPGEAVDAEEEDVLPVPMSNSTRRIQWSRFLRFQMQLYVAPAPKPKLDEATLRRRAGMLDDVPWQIRKRPHEEPRNVELLNEEQVAKRVRSADVVSYVCTALAEPQLFETENLANQWLSRSEVKRLSQLLDLPLSSARLHWRPRKRLQRPGRMKARSRITVMIGESQNSVLVGQERPEQVQERPQRKLPHLWRGLTMFPRLESKAGKQKQALVASFTWPWERRSMRPCP